MKPKGHSIYSGFLNKTEVKRQGWLTKHLIHDHALEEKLVMFWLAKSPISWGQEVWFPNKSQEV